MQERKFNVVAISGDLSQRARAGEFQRAQAFIRDAEAVSQDDRRARQPRRQVVEGAARHRRRQTGMYENYAQYIAEDLEPVLRVPGATFVGLNTSQGVTRHTLTWNVRDISIIGASHARRRSSARAPSSKARRRRRARHRDASQPGEGRAVAAPRTQEHATRFSARSPRWAWTSCCAATIIRKRCTTSSTRRRERSSRRRARSRTARAAGGRRR